MKMNKSKWTLLVLVMLFMLPQAKGQQAGLGMFRPAWFEQPVLYLYGPVEYNKTSQDHTPVDSIVFQVEDGGGVNIISAPPYLVPEHLKLDYDVLWFRVIGITGGFLEVIVNSTNGQTAYIRKDQGSFLYWPEFLTTISTVEPVAGNPLRIKPLDHASEVETEFAFLHAVAARDEWLMVELLDSDLNKISTAWLKWRNSERMLLTWSLFM
ncbi:MAG TPA: hypothetical protein DCG22_09085 [Bacteroidetes bacterium]|nr:hypothetical protein [Bacteroidota bacterium]